MGPPSPQTAPSSQAQKLLASLWVLAKVLVLALSKHPLVSIQALVMVAPIHYRAPAWLAVSGSALVLSRTRISTTGSALSLLPLSLPLSLTPGTRVGALASQDSPLLSSEA